MQRIAKYLAHRGVCSRRAAERLVVDGRVTVNGLKIGECSTLVADDDMVQVNNVAIASSLPEVKLWLYHKPIGLVTTHHDPQNRPTVFSKIKISERVISIGRLDINTSGLLLLTNNGSFARSMELPSSKILREYHVRVRGAYREPEHNLLCIKGINYKIENINVLSQTAQEAEISIALCEGKNREVRTIMAHLGLKVVSLKRVRYGDYRLGNLLVGQVEYCGIMTTMHQS